MKTKKVWANLSVKDLERTQKFYTQLGFELNGTADELVSFLVGYDKFVVHFFLEETFKWSTEGEIADLKKGNELMFTLSADSIEEVNEWAQAVKNAGGTVFRDPGKIGKEWYGCGFADPDGHKWNVFYNGK